MRIDFKKMASNEDVNLRKIENFARSKYHPEDISKDKGKRANFRKFCKNFKIVEWHLTYKEKRGWGWGGGGVIFGNNSKLLMPQHLSILS